jgi:hypothetical protein
MGLLNLEVKKAVVKVDANAALYQEAADTFNAMEVGEYFEIPDAVLPSYNVDVKVKALISLKEGEKVIISKIKAEDGKKSISVRFTKARIKAKTKPQGQVQATEQGS